MYRLILASQSPRRKELLGWIGVDFDIAPADIDEDIDVTDGRELVERLAYEKAQAVLKQADISKGPLVVASDTTVFMGSKIYAKPGNREEARQMLMELSGKEHTVYTAVALMTKSSQKVFSVSTQVIFSEISEDILGPYIQSGDSLDKAGAYGIQGMGLTFVASLNGSYSNVVGFPLVEFIGELKSFLADDLKQKGLAPEEWRRLFADKA